MSEFILLFKTFQTLINNNNFCAHFGARILILRFGIDELFHKSVFYKEPGANRMSARNSPETSWLLS